MVYMIILCYFCPSIRGCSWASYSSFIVHWIWDSTSFYDAYLVILESLGLFKYPYLFKQPVFLGLLYAHRHSERNYSLSWNTSLVWWWVSPDDPPHRCRLPDPWLHPIVLLFYLVRSWCVFLILICLCYKLELGFCRLLTFDSLVLVP